MAIESPGEQERRAPGEQERRATGETASRPYKYVVPHLKPET